MICFRLISLQTSGSRRFSDVGQVSLSFSASVVAQDLSPCLLLEYFANPTRSHIHLIWFLWPSLLVIW